MAVTKKPVKKPAAKKTTARRGRRPAEKKSVALPVKEEEVKVPGDTPDKHEDAGCCNEMVDLMTQVQSAMAMDIAHLSRLARIMFLDFLSSQGYKTMRITGLTDNMDAAANAEVLKFNHENKVVEFSYQDELIGCPAISKVYLEVHVNLDITDAEPYHPQTITQGNAVYVRVK